MIKEDNSLLCYILQNLIYVMVLQVLVDNGFNIKINIKIDNFHKDFKEMRRKEVNIVRNLGKLKGAISYISYNLKNIYQ